MNQASRQSKFKAKLAQKIAEKSILPNIQPAYAIQSKFKQTYTINQSSKKDKIKADTENQVSQNQTNYQIYQALSNNKAKQENEQGINFQTINIKNNSIQIQKQLMTADTVRPEHQNNGQILTPQETSSQGFDMWSLNKNLKQFSQTRKIGFFKTKNQNSNNSIVQNPYVLMNKAKTQDIRSIQKLYGGKSANPQRQKSQGQLKMKRLYEPSNSKRQTSSKFYQKEIKSLSTITKKDTLIPLDTTLYGTLPVRAKQTVSNFNQNNLRKTDNKAFSESKFQGPSHLNPYLRTFINGSHLKRQPSNRNINILQMNSFTTRQDSVQNQFPNEQKTKPLNNFRKNRFQKVQTPVESSAEMKIDDQYTRSLDYQPSPSKNLNEYIEDEKQFQDNEFRTTSSPIKIKAVLTLTNVEQKKRQYEFNRSIERINKFLLKSSDSYLEYYQQNSMPNSKIQFYIDSLNHPQFNNLANNKEYKSSYTGDEASQVGFDFEEKELKNKDKNKGKRNSSLGKQPKTQSKNK